MLQQQQRRRENVVSIDKLPPEILSLILIKLPPDSVCVCRGVRKSWNQLIHEPFFTKLHCSLSPLGITVIKNTRIFGWNFMGFAFVDLSFSSSRFVRGYKVNFTDKVIQTTRHELYGSLVGSCNGLICLTNFDYDSYGCEDGDRFRLVLCNSMLGTHFFLPDPPSVKVASNIHRQFGFGYIPSLAQYKVVRTLYLVQQRRLVSYACTIERCRDRRIVTHPWRETTGIANDGDGLIPKLRGLYSRSVFFHGSVICVADLENDDEEDLDILYCVIYFDLEKEFVQTLSIPPNTFAECTLGVYYDHQGNDHLYICEEDNSFANIWVMETYKCLESSCLRLKWQERIKWVIHLPSNSKSAPLKLFKVFEDGKLLISIENSNLALHDPSTGGLEILISQRLPGDHWKDLVLDTPSLLGCIL